MKTIWKYEPLASTTFTLSMPEGATILSVQQQHGVPQIWALVDPSRPMVARRFALVGTGNRCPDDIESFRFIGTFQMENGALVFHLFDAGVAEEIA